MPDVDRPTARTVVVIASVVLAALALRGYLPGAEPAPDEPEPTGPGALIPVIAMVVLALVIITVAIIGRRRDPVARPASSGELPRGAGAEDGRWTPRMLLIVIAAALIWLAIVVALMHLADWLTPEADPSAPVEAPPAGTPSGDGGGEPPPPPPASGTGLFGYLAAAAAVLMALSVIATVTGRRRRHPQGAPDAPSAPAPPPASGTQSLARAAERGLAEIGDLSREPREAIIACYAAMERELAKSPAMPLDSDTPSEVLARAVERGLLRADSATELVDLFEEARFSAHVMDEDHREAAVRVLRHVLGELQSSGTGTA